METKTDNLLLCQEEALLDSPLPPAQSPNNHRDLDPLGETVHPEEGSPPLWSLLDVGFLQNMLKREREHMPQLSCITYTQRRFITLEARRQVVKWFQQVQMFYGLHVQTVALAVNYFDRFHSTYRIQKDLSQEDSSQEDSSLEELFQELSQEELSWLEKPWGPQLLAVTCLSLAAKMEEVNPPCIMELQVGTPDVFPVQNVHDCEVAVLNTLHWRLGAVVPYSYLAQCIQVLQIPPKLWEDVMASCVEVLLYSLRDEKMQEFRPSITAIAIVWCVLENIELGDDNCNWEEHIPALSESFACSMFDLKECYEALDEVVFGPVESPESFKRDSQEMASQEEESACSCATMSPTCVLEFQHSCGKRNRSCETPEFPQHAKKVRYS